MPRLYLLAPALALGLSSTVALAAAPFELSYLGQQIVPSGTTYAGTVVGGLSSLDRVEATARYVAISDDRSQFNPARYYELSLDLSAFGRSAAPGMAGVGFHAVATIQNTEGSPFGTNTVDPEAMRFNPASGTLYWANEGQRSGGGFQNPTVREMNPDGSPIRAFAVPGKFNPVGSNSGLTAGDRGIYNNLAFESMALSADGSTLYVATENALAQDSLPSTVLNGSRARIVSFDTGSGAAGAEYVYDVEPVALAPNPITGFATNGLTDFIAVADRQFVAIERSFAAGAATPGSPETGNTIRLYHVDARGATDVSALDSIAGQNIVAVSKTLLLNLSDLKNDDNSSLALDNIEGIAWGPVSANGRPTLILVSDNNFSGSQFTQFVALEISPVPEPDAYALMLGGLGLIGWMSRRRSAR